MRVFGRPQRTPEELVPLGDDFYDVGGPNVVGEPPRSACNYPRVMRYRGVVFGTCAGRVYHFMVTARGARTRRGVGIGDRLAKAKKAYPRLECGTQNEDGEYPTYPYCAGKVAPDRFAWFGEDPVRSIFLSSLPLEYPAGI